MGRYIKHCLGFLLLLGGLLSVSAAEIRGTIHHAGSPVTNVVVGVYRYVESSFGSYWGLTSPFGSVVVEPDGSYVIDISAGSNYVVQVTPDVTAGLLPLYYPDSDSIWDASLIITADDSPATNINFDLKQGAEVSGLVLADSVGISDATVWIDDGDFGTAPQSSRTDSNGFYKILVAPGSNYVAEVSPENNSGFLSEYYSNAVSSVDALEFIATLDFPATNINFDLEPAARISGTIVSGSNVVLDVSVTVYQKTDQRYDYVEYGDVGSNGIYSVWVPPGSNYLVKASPYRDAALLPEYYNEVDLRENAELLTVSLDVPLEDINFDLDPGVWISGVVMSGTNVEEGARVEVQEKVYDEESSSWNYMTVGSDSADYFGEYNVLVSPGTNYVVFASLSLEYPLSSLSPLRGFYYDAETSRGSALVVSATLASPAVNIDFDLGRLPILSGKVMSGGTPLAGATVSIFHRTEWPLPSGGGEISAVMNSFVASTEVAANGFYEVRLGTGSNYFVLAVAADGSPFIPEYYNDVRSSRDAERFSLYLDGSETNVNFDLSVGFQIQGSVNTEDGNAVPSPSISVYDGLAQTANQVSGNMDGLYFIYAPTGEPVYVSASGFNVQREYYSNSWTHADATPLSGETGDVVTADFVLFRSDADRDGDGLPDYQEEVVPDGVYQPGVDHSNLSVGDTDQDGVSDYHEKICKTDPVDQSDYLYISDSVVTPDGILLRWQSKDRVVYCVERCSNLSVGEWEEISEFINGDGLVLQFTDSSVSEVKAFYRIRVLDPSIP